MQWLNNPWVVGVGGGLLSGIIVTWLSRVIFSKRDDRERRQRIATANREILYAVRPGIAENVVPNPNVLDSLIAATARKYQLSSSEIYSPREILDDLIKEVMDSSFISAAAKADFCLKLSGALQQQVELETPETEFEVVEAHHQSEYRQKTLSIMSMTLGLMTAIMTAIVPFILEKRSWLHTSKSDLPTVFIPTLIALGTVLIVTLTFTMLRWPKALLKRTDDKTEQKDPET